MATMDTPREPHDSDSNVSDLEAFIIRKNNTSSEALDPETLHDAAFAHYRLAVWAHPSSLPRILDIIERDLLEDNPRAAPSITRLRTLINDPRFEKISNDHDPYANNFTEALDYVSSDRQTFALLAVQRLHIITLSSETTPTGVSTHIRPLVEAILSAPATPK